MPIFEECEKVPGIFYTQCTTQTPSQKVFLLQKHLSKPTQSYQAEHTPTTKRSKIIQ